MSFAAADGKFPARLATPERLFFNRRAFLAGTGIAALALSLPADTALAQRASDLPDPTKDLYPVKRNDKFALDRPVTDEKINTSYNNFYEFGSEQDVAKPAQALKLRPWTVKIDGMVEKPQEIGIDDLIRKMPLEERLYRHRCVEAWSMAIPWSGFPFAKLVELAKPLSSAKYRADGDLPRSRDRARPKADLVSVALCRGPDDRRGDQRTRLPGHRRLRQAGAEAVRARRCGSRCRGNTASSRSSRSCASASPISGRRAIGRRLQAAEYGFWANVNPQVAHPRWSQATEELIGLNERRPTLLFNGYGEYVADLYKGLEKERLWV